MLFMGLLTNIFHLFFPFIFTMTSNFKILFFPNFSENVYRRGARRWNKFYNIHGHRFQVKRSNKRINCALCDESIWGLGRGGLRCVDCGMFVHKKCHKFVRKVCTKEVGNYPRTPIVQKTVFEGKGAQVFPKKGPENQVGLDQVSLLQYNCLFLGFSISFMIFL